MATSNGGPTAPAFGIAHATAVPENFDPDGTSDGEGRPVE